MDTLAAIGILALAYLAGTLPGALIICRLFRLANPLETGSGNPGATNVYRLGGALPALLTLLIDAGKGALAVGLAVGAGLSDAWQVGAALLAITGHMYPLILKHRGGKGVATTLGTGLIISPQLILLLAALWALVLWRCRVSAIASVTVAATAPLLALWLDPDLTPYFAALGVLILVRHRSNFKRSLKPPRTD